MCEIIGREVKTMTQPSTYQDCQLPFIPMSLMPHRIDAWCYLWSHSDDGHTKKRGERWGEIIGREAKK